MIDDDATAVPPLRRIAAGLRLLVTLTVFAALLALTIYFGVYESQLVRIDKVEQVCVMEPSHRHRSGFYARPIPMGDCKKLALAYRTDSRWRYDYRAPKPHIFISFTYLSPHDGAEHSGRLMRDVNDAGQPVHVGDQIWVYSSRWFASVYTDFSSPSWSE